MRIAMLLHKSVQHDGRVQREATALATAGHEVVIVHLPRADPSDRAPAPEGCRLSSASPRGWAARLPGPIRRPIAAARIAVIARREHPEVVHAHDAAMLLPGWIAARTSGARLVYDSHELATGVPYRSRPWAAAVGLVERSFVRRADAVITVSDGIAARLQTKYALSARPTVVRNVPDLPPPAGSPETVRDLRALLGAGSAPLILHQGAVAADRGGECLIRAVREIDGAHLLFLGAQGPYSERLRRLSQQLGIASRVHLEPPAPLVDLLSYTAQADVGVTLLEDTCENHRLALPNKLFEYVAAGIPVVASDLPEAAAVVRAHEIGWLVDPADPTSVAEGLRAALEARGDPRLRARLQRAREALAWPPERHRLLELYARLEAEAAEPLSASSA